MANIGTKVALLVLVVGLIAIGAGGTFIGLGFQKAALIKDAMVAQNIEYTGAGGDIVGIIDTPTEAQVMAGVLEQHRTERYGSYTQMTREDPNRQQVLNAMTMENALNMAVMGFGLTDVVKGTGAFMILVGFTFVLLAIPGLRQKKELTHIS